MWNLEKWDQWSYLQSRNRDTDVENKCMDTETESWGGVVAGDTLEIYVYKTDS